MNAPVIAIDGPAGSGKGTLSRLLAKELVFDLLDTGLLYRAVAARCVQAKLDLDDEQAIVDFLPHLLKIDTSNQVLLRSEAMGGNASKVSRYSSVRQHLFDYQRQFAQYPPSGRGAILDGRDIGTVIFPETPYKFYLSASAEVRAKRRYAEMYPDGGGDYDAILADVIRRDENDQNRAIAPLRPADDALHIESSYMNPEAVLQKALDYLNRQGLR